MPAAAVIPAPIAYIKVAAVKKLVVGFLAKRLARHVSCVSAWCLPSFECIVSLHWVVRLFDLLL